MNLDEYNSKYRKYIDYIDKYRGEANAATASEVDSNANVENKNVTTCAEELTKREKIGTNRLLMIDKITEMYGPELAAKYIEELEGHKIYKHDETSIYPYTYGAEEMVNVMYNDVTYTLAMEDLYDLCTEPEKLLDAEKEVYGKFPVNMYIEDRSDEVGAESMLSNITPVERLIKKKRHRDMVRVKTASEDSLIVTDNHPMLVNDDIDDTVDALDCRGKQQYKSKYHFGFLNCQRLYVNEKHPDVLVDYDLGYAVGKFAGRGLFTEMGTVELKQCGLVETDKKGRCTYKCELAELPDFDMDDLYTLFHDVLEMRSVDILGTPSLPRTMFTFSKCFSDGILSGMYDSGYFLDNNLNHEHIKCIVTHSRKLALQIKALLRNLGEESGNVVHTEDGLYKIQINGVYTTERGWNNIEETKTVTDKMELANCDWIYDITTGSHTFICNGLWVHNCVSITMYPFLFEGLKGLGGLSKAPKNLDSFAGSFINLVFAIAAQFAGAVSTPEFLMYMDYFVRKDYGDNYYMQPDRITTSAGVTRKRTIRDVVHDKFQQVVYSLNQPAAARGYQAVFWNIAYFDKPYFEGMFEDFVFPDASEPTWESVNWLQHEFMDWFNKERLKAELTFPVETMNLLDDGTTYVDQDQFDFAAEMYSKGHSFFTYRSGSVDSLASCCRLRSEIQENEFSYTLGAGGVSTGSKGVMTININRLVQNATRDGVDISAAVTDQVERVHKYLLAFNEVINDNYKAGLLGVYNAQYISLPKQFLTIGANGFLEGAEFLGIDISPNKKYQHYVESILRPIYELNKRDRTKEIMFNTEFVPAENLGVKNAKWDKEDGYVVPRDCYNSYFYKVEDESCNVLDKFILHGDKFTKYLDGGSALHVNLEEHLSKEQYKTLMFNAIKTGCNYFTFNIPNMVCNKCGYISKHPLEKCPICGSEDVDYMTRIIGYLKRVSKWSEARQKEADTRYYAKEVK